MRDLPIKNSPACQPARCASVGVEAMVSAFSAAKKICVLTPGGNVDSQFAGWPIVATKPRACRVDDFDVYG